MLEILQFVFSSFWVFSGTCVLMAGACVFVSELAGWSPFKSTSTTQVEVDFSPSLKLNRTRVRHIEKKTDNPHPAAGAGGRSE